MLWKDSYKFFYILLSNKREFFLFELHWFTTLVIKKFLFFAQKSLNRWERFILVYYNHAFCKSNIVRMNFFFFNLF